MEVILANARHIANIPTRQNDLELILPNAY